MAEPNSLNLSVQEDLQEMYNEEVISSSEMKSISQLEPQEKVFNNSLIIDEIMKNLDNHDLLTVRGVNCLSSYIGASILHGRRDVCVSLHYSYDYECYQDGCRRTLNQLIDGFWRSKKFPFSWFRFFGGDLGSSDVQEFFSIYGHHIKAFEMSCKVPDKVPHTTIDTLRRLLVQDLHNLEYLALESTPKEWDCEEVKLFPEPVQLSNLKILKLDSDVDCGVLKEILTAAINLTQTIGFKLKYLTTFLSTGQLYTVKHLDFRPFPFTTRVYSKYAEEIKISHLQSINTNFSHVYCEPESWSDVASVLQKILTKNKETLERIIQFHPLGFLPAFQLPIFDKVEEIHFLDLSELYSIRSRFIHNFQDQRLLPTGQQFSHVFPNLSKITFDRDFVKRAVFVDLVHSSQSLPSVKELTVLQATTWMAVKIENMGVAFPNVERLEIDFEDFFSFTVISRVICGFLRLLTLKISIENLMHHHRWETWEEMDPMTTRHPRYVSAQVRKVPGPRDVKNIWVFPTVWQLEGLRSLSVTTSCSRLDGETIPIFSLVSGVFGFELPKKKLRVSSVEFMDVCYRERISSLLKPFEPYIRIV